MRFSPSSSLSSCQLDIWTGSSLFPELPQYNLVICDQVSGPLDLDLMRACLARAAQRQNALRLCFDAIDGVPEQWVDPVSPEVQVVDLRDAQDPAAACADWLRDSFDRPFVLTAGIPVELTLLREDESTSYVQVRAHHIVTDAWGLRLLMTQVRADYEHMARTGEHLEQVSPSYLAAVAAEAEYRGSARQQADRAYFRQVLDGVEPALFTRKAPSGSRRTGRHSFTVERELVNRIRDRGESPFVFISAAVSIYLSRVHRSGDVVLGIPLLNRYGQQAKNTVGHFANTLPLRVSASPDQSLGELIDQVRDGTRALLRHGRLALGEVLRDRFQRDGRGGQLFDTTISYLRWPAPVELPGLSYRTVAQTHAHDQDALAMWVYEFDGVSDLRVDLEYARDVFDEDFPAQAAAEHILTLLRNAAGLPDAALREVPMLTDAQRHTLVVAHNDTAVDHELDITLPELFARQVARTPDRIAVTDALGDRLTFAELH
ncbi:MAG: condensation domain-containing protein, partial [Actinobacteria bacterium]|nr:condensation domain-containing protein [Actinomycetota bacterium]